MVPIDTTTCVDLTSEERVRQVQQATHAAILAGIAALKETRRTDPQPGLAQRLLAPSSAWWQRDYP